MASIKTDIQVWTETYGAEAASRVAKRIKRFAGNTMDADTSLAAEALVNLIENAIPDKTPMGETDNEDLVGT